MTIPADPNQIERVKVRHPGEVRANEVACRIAQMVMRFGEVALDVAVEGCIGAEFERAAMDEAAGQTEGIVEVEGKLVGSVAGDVEVYGEVGSLLVAFDGISEVKVAGARTSRVADATDPGFKVSDAFGVASTVDLVGQAGCVDQAAGEASIEGINIGEAAPDVGQFLGMAQVEGELESKVKCEGAGRRGANSEGVDAGADAREAPVEVRGEDARMVGNIAERTDSVGVKVGAMCEIGGEVEDSDEVASKVADEAAGETVSNDSCGVLQRVCNPQKAGTAPESQLRGEELPASCRISQPGPSLTTLSSVGRRSLTGGRSIRNWCNRGRSRAIRLVHEVGCFLWRSKAR
ncbi:hypothetical protein [Streptomyces sp. NBC_01022]|uniref:hypothetical protein n=1 Tax=Streptomyces sp. NBC_01022 TaxID=2903723 RepID=UPI002DD997C5|nr:hypothetical protein [Streptomyces sp. NBC_01022]WRZ82627.1 hypothetical protein OG316_21380 [Streptomyces sp. NBC_01022]